MDEKDSKNPFQNLSDPPVDENIFKNLPPLDSDLATTGRLKRQGTGRFQTGHIQTTGRFQRVPKNPRPVEEDLSPTQKIILFPTEESQKLPTIPDFKPKKPPIVFTAPLPKIQDLPSDFFEEGELDELYDPSQESPDFSKYLQGDDFAEFDSGEGKLASLMRELERKADSYADSMFLESENEDLEQIERLERLIPGTDQEDGKRVRVAPSREKIKKVHPKHLPPDLEPKELGKKLHKGHRFRKLRRKTLFASAFFASFLSFYPMEYSGEFVWITKYENQVLTLGLLLVFGMLLCSDLLWKGFLRSFRLRWGMDTLGLFSGLFCGLDCFLQLTGGETRGEYPYVALVLLQYGFLLYGDEEKRKANLCGCQVAGISESPYLICYEPGKWNALPTYTKSSGAATDFTSQLQQEDGAQQVFALVSPFLLIASFLLALNLTRTTADFVWALSAMLVVSSPLAGGFVYGRPAYKIAYRLKDLYTALAGWTGVAKKCQQCVIGDEDLFPVGDVRITGRQEYNGFSEKKILAYTSALLQEGDVGFSKLFQDMMAYRGQKCPRCKQVAFHDGGGISAQIGMDQVLVGGAAFTELMNVTIPEGLFVNHAVFCSINGRLGGFFALEYSMNQIANHSLDNLVYERIRPVLATRDFSLTPEILKKRFHLNTFRMDFPSVLRRYDLSARERPKECILTGILTREGIASVADCVIGAKRLRQTVYQGLGICVISAVLGLCLVAYLVASLAYTSLSADNLMIFMLLWFAPVWVLTDLPQRF